MLSIGKVFCQFFNNHFPTGIIGCGYFCPSRFDPEVCEIVKKIVPATRTLWQMTKVYLDNTLCMIKAFSF